MAITYTNKYELPDYVVAFLTHDTYDYIYGTFSATGLLKPTRQIVLSAKHKGEMVYDVSDFLASRHGTAIHAAFEDVPMPGMAKETRVFREVEVDGKLHKISGKPDMIRLCKPRDDGTYAPSSLIDLKSTSVWSYVFEGKTEDYIKQLSVYRWLLLKNGYPDMSLTAEICYFFTDWAKRKAAEDPRYLNCRVAVKNIMLWDEKTTEKFIVDKLRDIENATNGDLPECPESELWMSKTGKPNRCDYCSARPFCEQHKKYCYGDTK